MQKKIFLPIILMLSMTVLIACARCIAVEKPQTYPLLNEEIGLVSETIASLDSMRFVPDIATTETYLIGEWQFLHYVWYDSSSETEIISDSQNSLVVYEDLTFTFVDIGAEAISEGYIDRDYAGHLIAVIEIDGSDDWIWGLRYDADTGRLQIITNFDSSIGDSLSLEWLHYYFQK
jgi:hypothetical protein